MLSEGILDCLELGLRNVRGDKENSVAYHYTNSPGALNVKAGEKLVSTILAASTACQESRLGTTLEKRCYSPNVRADGFGATCSQLGLRRDCINKGMLDFLFEENTIHGSKLLLERAVYCQQQDGENIRRAAHRSRAQGWRSS